MQSLGDLLSKRLEAYKSEPAEAVFKREGKEYNKRWSRGVQFFVDAINKDRVGTQYPPVSFIVVRQRLVALRDIEDLRWFYYHCKKYGEKEGHSFSQCFFGATKTK